MGVDIGGRGSSRLSGPHRHVATTKTSQRVAEARSTADDGGRIVMWPGCSTSHMAMWPHEDARRFARMDPHGVTARPPRGCDRWSTRAAGRALPADRRTRAPGGASSRRQLDGARALRGHRSRGSTSTPAAALTGPHRHVATPRPRSALRATGQPRRPSRGRSAIAHDPRDRPRLCSQEGCMAWWITSRRRHETRSPAPAIVLRYQAGNVILGAWDNASACHPETRSSASRMAVHSAVPETGDSACRVAAREA